MKSLYPIFSRHLNIDHTLKHHLVFTTHCHTYICTAHELRAWLLHYSPVVLREILTDVYYQHHLLLVEGVFILLKDVVSGSDVTQSSHVLQHYCYLFSSLYGKLITLLTLYYIAVIAYIIIRYCRGTSYVSESPQFTPPAWSGKEIGSSMGPFMLPI